MNLIYHVKALRDLYQQEFNRSMGLWLAKSYVEGGWRNGDALPTFIQGAEIVDSQRAIRADAARTLADLLTMLLQNPGNRNIVIKEAANIGYDVEP